MWVKALYLKDYTRCEYSFLPKCNQIFGRILDGETESLRNLLLTIIVQINQFSQLGNKLIIHSCIAFAHPAHRIVLGYREVSLLEVKDIAQMQEGNTHLTNGN